MVISLWLAIFTFMHVAYPSNAEAVVKSISQGRAITLTEEISECRRGRTSSVGEIKATDGKLYTLPAKVQYAKRNFATDLHNTCTGVRSRSLDDVHVRDVPIIDIDPDGDVVTAMVFADNYFELYINGQLVGVDSVPFTPFNASIVRFRIKKPYVIAAQLVDWEENLGLGTEQNRGSRYHPGDGGFVAHFSDGTKTDQSWQALVHYVSPVANLKAAKDIDDRTRNTSTLPSGRAGCGEKCYAVHWPIPKGWQNPGFDASDWPAATEYSNDTVGVNNKPSYMNFEDQFIGQGATFIWSSNLVLDNVVLVRKVVK